MKLRSNPDTQKQIVKALRKKPQTLSELAAAGMQLIDEQPRTGIRGSRVAFVHPKSTDGVLTEIVQPAAEVH